MSQPTAFADPPIGADGLIDVFAFATRVPGSPEVRPSGIDLAALDAATPAAPVGPLGLPAEPTPARPKVEDHELLVAEVAAEQQTDPTLPEGAFRVDLKDTDGENTIATFVIRNAEDWPGRINSWMGDPMKWDDWVMRVLSTDDERDLWMALEPTNRQINRFVTEYLRVSGNLPAPKGQR